MAAASHLSDHAVRRLRSESLSTSWLASRLGIQPARLDALRRDGELLGVRANGDGQYHYPAWQFRGGRPLPVMRELLATARGAGVDAERLYSLLDTRAGLHDGERLADLLRNGGKEYVLRAVQRAGAANGDAAA